jgi:hypothetical protein
MQRNWIRFTSLALTLTFAISASAQDAPLADESISVSPDAGLPNVESVPPVGTPSATAHPSHPRKRAHHAVKRAKHKAHKAVHKAKKKARRKKKHNY